ncbi:MAG: HsdM family class I SAM-dependent methyltransferase [Actinomycetota bacterium]
MESIAGIGFGDDSDRARDILGRTYEYFIREFARAEGHRGEEFYTPRSVTRLPVEMLEPFEGRVLDPACGSGRLFVQSAEVVKAHGGRARQISILGQENNQATWRIAKMNLAIHGIAGDIKLGDSLLNDLFSGRSRGLRSNAGYRVGRSHRAASRRILEGHGPSIGTRTRPWSSA